MALRRPPIRRDLYADRSGWTDDADPFTESGGFNQRGEWMALLGDVRTVWVAAWIDSRDGLESAYRRILAIPNPATRDALLNELADATKSLVSIGEVQAASEERRRREKQSDGDVDRWRAVQRIEWADRFRKHYEQIEAKARRPERAGEVHFSLVRRLEVERAEAAL